jgi:hypothetical protein
MTWVWAVLVVIVVGGLVAWASIKQRHAGDYTMDQAKRDAERREGTGGGFVG